MKPLRLSLLSVAILLAGAAVAMAQAIVTADVNVYGGPGIETGVVGTIPANSPITVDHCENNFCFVYYARSGLWIEQQYIGESPAPPPQPQPQPPVNPSWPWPQPQPQPLPPPVYDDEAGACFYSERNFRGSSFCVDEGDSYSRLRNWDNKIRSVEVFGGVRVDLCTDSNYRGSCVTLRRDASRLPAELDRKASSIDVY
jgi:hypothetical protein